MTSSPRLSSANTAAAPPLGGTSVGARGTAGRGGGGGGGGGAPPGALPDAPPDETNCSTVTPYMEQFIMKYTISFYEAYLGVPS